MARGGDLPPRVNAAPPGADSGERAATGSGSATLGRISAGDGKRAVAPMQRLFFA